MSDRAEHRGQGQGQGQGQGRDGSPSTGPTGGGWSSCSGRWRSGP